MFNVIHDFHNIERGQGFRLPPDNGRKGDFSMTLRGLFVNHGVLSSLRKELRRRIRVWRAASPERLMTEEDERIFQELIAKRRIPIQEQF